MLHDEVKKLSFQKKLAILDFLKNYLFLRQQSIQIKTYNLNSTLSQHI